MEISQTALTGGSIALIALVALITKFSDRNASKRAKIYETIRENEDKADKKYMPIKMCDERSKNTQRQLNDLKTGQTTILEAVNKRNGQ